MFNKSRQEDEVFPVGSQCSDFRGYAYHIRNYYRKGYGNVEKTEVCFETLESIDRKIILRLLKTHPKNDYGFK